MNNITLNWSAEDRARIDKLTELLEQCIAAKAAPVIETEDEVLIADPKDWELPPEDGEKPAEKPEEDAPKDETPAKPEKAENGPTVTKQDILQKVVALCGAGKKAEAKDIITTYADSVSDLPDCALEEVWERLTALEG